MMNLGINLKDNLTELKFGKNFKKSTWNLSRLFFMLLSLMVGLTWQFNAYAQELDYADKSGKAAEIIKKSEQYQGFLALQKRIAEENGDRVRKFEVYVDGINAKVIPSSISIDDIRFSGFPMINIKRKKTNRNIESFKDIVVLNKDGYIEQLKINPKYKKEIDFTTFFISKDNQLKGLSIKNDFLGEDKLDLSLFSRLESLRIYESKYNVIKLPLKSSLLCLEVLFSPVKKLENLNKTEKLKSIVINDVEVSDLSDLIYAKDLQRLELEGDSVATEKKPNLSDFNDLQYLSFNSKYIKGIVEIEGLHKLKRLYVGAYFNYEGIDFPNALEYLQLAGKVNEKMPNLKGNINLVALSLSRTKVKKIEGLDDLINLKELKLIRNDIDEISGLNELENLKELNLAGNKIKKIEGLSNIDNIKKIDLQYNEIEKIEGFENLPHLESILLGHNKIKKIESVNFMTWLDVLSLHHNPIDTFDYQSIAGLENTKVIIRNTPLSDILTDEEKEKYYDMHRYLRF